MNIVEQFFSPWEGTIITTWEEAIARINAISVSSKQRQLAWRGQASASWPLHSSLYRKIPFVTNNQFTDRNFDDRALQIIEEPLIKFLQHEWRFSDKSALEILATVQHYHGSTRLIDVSLNSLIALYFAVEENGDKSIENSDARMFAFSIDDRIINIQDSDWNAPTVPWLGNFKADNKWCIEPPLFWKPPTYNPRIQVQQSGFLLAGVPKSTSNTGSKLVKGPGSKHHNTYWGISELRQVSSVPLRMSVINSGSRNKELAFTFRISSAAKKEIREKLSSMFNINSSSVYPDDFGAAQAAEKFIDTGKFI